MSKKGYEMKAEGQVAEILLYDVIDGRGFGGITAKQFVQDLQKLGDVPSITVRINSPGGSVFEGTAIYNALKSHPAKIDVFIDGMALSMASVIAMAGDKITIAENAMIMIHEPSINVSGNARRLRKTAETLDKTKQSILTSYTKRTGKSESEISVLMGLETWMNADEALEHGFVDAISESKAPSAEFDLAPFGFKRVPDGLVPKNAEPKKVTTKTVDEAVADERNRFKGIIDSCVAARQPHRATEFLASDLTLLEIRSSLFDGLVQKQESKEVNSEVAVVPAKDNALVTDAKNRSQH